MPRWEQAILKTFIDLRCSKESFIMSKLRRSDVSQIFLKKNHVSLKGDAMNPIRNTLSITTSAFSQHTRDQQVSAYNHSCLTIIQSHGCKETPVGILHAEKMVELILINVQGQGNQCQTPGFKFEE